LANITPKVRFFFAFLDIRVISSCSIGPYLCGVYPWHPSSSLCPESAEELEGVQGSTSAQSLGFPMGDDDFWGY